MDQNAWDRVRAELEAHMSGEDFRRWFGSTAYASDSGDQITVWVGSESIRRHIYAHYQELLDRSLAAIGRRHTQIRFLVAGFGDDDD